MSINWFRYSDFAQRPCAGRTLVYDEACLELESALPDVTFLRQYAECDGCECAPAPPSGGRGAQFALSTVYPVRYEIRAGGGGEGQERLLCAGTYGFREYGRYRLNVTRSGNCSEIGVVEAPDEPAFPLLAAVVLALLAATAWYACKALHRRCFSRYDAWQRLASHFEPPLVPASPPPPPAALERARSRVRSLDTFRGLVVALMIFVNYGGGGYAPMRHAPWNGLTLADCVFPCFAWLMGFSLCLALHSRLRTSMKRRAAFFQILRRSVTLVCLGIILSSKENVIENLRLPGVLQRLGVAYFLAGTLECFFIDASSNYISGIGVFRDLRATFWQWSGTLAFVAIHASLTFLLKVPGCPTGYLGPGGLHNKSSYVNCTGGATAYIDEWVFGESHLYKRGSFRILYESKTPFDPEGLLGTLSCVLVVQLGAQAARVLLAYSHARARVSRWVLWGCIAGLVGGGLCTFSENGGPIPINKNLWSLSFSLVTSSIAFMILAFLYLIIDVYPLWQGRPFYYAGRNAILLYLGHELLKGRFPFEWKLHHPSHTELLAMNSFAVFLWLVIAIFLHRKNIILTI